MPDDNTLRALQAAEHCDYETACGVLHTLGYGKIGNGSDQSTVFRLKDSGCVVRVFRERYVPAAMMQMGKAVPGNPFLPRLDEYRRLSDNAHALVMEALIDPADVERRIGAQAFRPLGGFLDAYGNFPLGDEKHKECHKAFHLSARNGNLGPLLQALAGAIAECYEGDPARCLRLNNRTRSRMLLRPAGSGYFPVFADPLTMGDDRAAALAEMRTMLERCENLLGLPAPKRLIGKTPEPPTMLRH